MEKIKARGIQLFSLFCLVQFVLCAPPALPSQPIAADQVREVVSTGRGAIINNDKARARDEAIIDARVRALEEEVGVLVDADTLVQNNLLLDSTVRNTTQGWIRAELILKEWEENDMVMVKLRATISPQDLRERLQDLASNTSILIHLQEKVCGENSEDLVMESAVIEKLVDAGYIVLDPIQTERIKEHETRALILKGDLKAAKKAGLRFLSNLFATGKAEAKFSQNNNGWISAIVTVTLRVVQTDTGKIVAQISDYSTKGLELDCPAAARKALLEAGAKAATKVQEKLADYLNNNKRRVTVIAHGLADQSAYERLANILRGVRWGSEVQLEGLNGNIGTYSLGYPEKTVYLVKAITIDQRYQLVEFSWSKIVIRQIGHD